MEKIAAVILAAGKGKRMGGVDGSPIPKVMFSALGKPLIERSLDNVKAAGVSKICLVVGYKKEMVENYIGDRAEYCVQEEQLGTGHAAAMAKGALEGKSEAVIVCYGDMPLFQPETIKNLIDLFEKEKPTIAMLSVSFDDPEFWAYGRIVRDENNEVVAIVEQKDCDENQLKISESNPGFYIFDGTWLWENLENLGSDNAQNEYYITDLIGMAISQGRRVMAMGVSEEEEVLGVNTPEQLEKVEEIIRKRENK